MKAPRRILVALLCVLTAAASLLAPMVSLCACPEVVVKSIAAEQTPNPCHKSCCAETEFGASCCCCEAPSEPSAPGASCAASAAACGCSTPSDAVPPQADVTPACDLAIGLNVLDEVVPTAVSSSAIPAGRHPPGNGDLLALLSRLTC